MTTVGPAAPAVGGPAALPPADLVPYGDDWMLFPSVFARIAGLPFDRIEIAPTAGYADALSAAERAVAALLDDPLFTEALTWQNRQMLRVARRNAAVAAPSRRREAQRRLWGYASRYCAKNDTIGFFGPIGWGSVVPDGTAVGPRDGRLLRRGVFFEHWALRAVAAALQTRHDLRPWTVPRLAAGSTLTPAGVLLADNALLRLPPIQLRTLQLCDGRRTEAEVVAELAAAGTGTDADAVRSGLDRLRAMGVLTSGLTVPRRLDPERQLRGQLMRVTEPVRRTAALAELAELVRARDAVAVSAGDPARLDAALDALESVFARITGRPAQRGTGQFYAGRGVVFEDCLGATPVRIGADLTERIRPALELVLASAVWFVRAVHREYAAFVADLVVAGEPTPGAGIPLSAVVDAVAAAGQWGNPSPADAAAERLRHTWRSVLLDGARPGQRWVRHSAQALRGSVLAGFAHPGGWAGSRMYSPDLMFSAGSVAELRAGRFLAVLGELHPAHNTMDVVAADAWHPAPDRLHAWIDRAAGDRMVPLYPLDHEQVNSRTVPPASWLSPAASYLGIGAEPPYQPPGARLVPVSSLRVVRDADAVVVRSVTDPDFQADVTAVLGDFIANAAATRFGVLPVAGHRPRVSVDDLVVQRESWTLHLSELHLLGAKQRPPEQRYAALRATCLDRGMPRHLFVSVDGERKPVHLDLANPISVDTVLSRIRAARQRRADGCVTFVEMLPDPTGLWLTDESGQRYTAEFRLVCVERAGPPETVDRAGPPETVDRTVRPGITTPAVGGTDE